MFVFKHYKNKPGYFVKKVRNREQEKKRYFPDEGFMLTSMRLKQFMPFVLGTAVRHLARPGDCLHSSDQDACCLCADRKILKYDMYY